MRNEEKQRINREVKALNINSYNVLEVTEDNGESIDIVNIIIDGVLFTFSEIETGSANGFYEYIVEFTYHSLHNEYSKNVLKYVYQDMIELEEGEEEDRVIEKPEYPEYTYYGELVTSPENLVAFNTIADKILVDNNNEEARKHLSYKLEEHIAKQLHNIQEKEAEDDI